MLGAPPVPNEVGRLCALWRYQILDTSAEKVFDDFTALAAQICGTPISSISFIDEQRQWYKSSVGLTMEETPRELSFCGHTILGKELLEVPDTLEDDRFRANPYVTGQGGIRYYAGMPLTTPDGHNLGTLCVADIVPRQLTPVQRQALITLGRQVMAQLELRVAKRELQLELEEHQKTEAQLAFALKELKHAKLEEAKRLRAEQIVTEKALLGSEAEYRKAYEQLRQSLQKYEFLADTVPQIVWTTKPDGSVDYFNQRWVEYTGITLEQAKDWQWAPVLHPDDLDRCIAAWTKTVTTGCRYEFEYRFRRKDGAYRWHLARAFPLKNDKGEVIQWVGSSTDIDDQKRSQALLESRVAERTEELSLAKDRLQAVLDAATQVAIIALDPGGLITVFNSGAEHILGYRAGEIVHQFTLGIFTLQPEVEARAEEMTRELGRPIGDIEVFLEKPRGGNPEEREWTCVRKDGTHLTVNLVMTASHDEEGGVAGYLAVAMDVTARKKAEETLRASEERFRLLIDSVKDYALFMLDPNGIVVSWNTGAERIKGYRADEIIGRHFSCFYPMEAIARGHPEHELAVATRDRSYAEEGWRVRKDGSRFLAEVVITAICDQGKLKGFAKVTRDITARKSAEQALRDQALMLDLANDTICIRDPEDHIIYWNQGAERLYGWKSAKVIGTVVHTLLQTKFPLPLEEIRTQLASTGRWEGELVHTRRDGTRVVVASSWTLQSDETTRKPGTVIELNHDMTARKQAEEVIQAALAEKDVLLREIHHRVKNNMQVISSLLQLQSSYLKDATDVEIFKECQVRIRSMALVHETLYRSNNLATINFADYLKDLARLVAESQRRTSLTVSLLNDCEPVELGLDIAIPLGLIANELISNAFKHAFLGRKTGILRLTLKKGDQDRLIFAVADDGVGFPGDFAAGMLKIL